MAATVTWEGLRDLASFRAENGCAISFYVDLDPSVTPTPDVVQSHVNALLDEVVRSEMANRGELTHEQKQGLRDDVDRLRQRLAAAAAERACPRSRQGRAVVLPRAARAADRQGRRRACGLRRA